MNPYSRQLIDEEDIKAISEVLGSSHLTQGPVLERFEEALCEYTGARYALACNSATSALYLLYASLHPKSGDEVITSPISFCATANMLVQNDITPVFTDIRYEDGNIDAGGIEAKITPSTRAVVAIDFAGNPVEIAMLEEICSRHNIKLFFDSSHALGSSYQGRKLGSFGDGSVFSFHAIKPITTGEGGALVTNDADIYERAKLLRSHGVVKKQLWNQDVEAMGFNFRLSDINAALGLSQLKKLDGFLEQREEIAAYYDARFKGNPYFQTIPISAEKKSARHLYPILLERSLWCAKEQLFTTLHESGLGVQVHYRPIHMMRYYKNRFGEQRFINSEDFFKAELSIPCHQAMGVSEAKEVADTLMGALEGLKGCASI